MGITNLSSEAGNANFLLRAKREMPTADFKFTPAKTLTFPCRVQRKPNTSQRRRRDLCEVGWVGWVEIIYPF